MAPVNALLGLFAKWPSVGNVKTRLAADTSPQFAADVARAFLCDCVTRYAQLPARREIAFAPIEERENFAALAGERWTLRPQHDGDLGARLDHFFAEAFRDGADRVVVVGTDSPTLPVDFVVRAFDELARRDVVIGPATDGGYYLIGLARPAPQLFTNVQWSRSDVLAQTLDRLGDSSLGLLPPWYDVDTHDDWIALGGHLRASRRAGIDPRSPHTESLIDAALKIP